MKTLIVDDDIWMLIQKDKIHYKKRSSNAVLRILLGLDKDISKDL